MRALAFGVDKAGEGTLEITSDWLDEEIELSWMKEYVQKSDCGLTFLQTSGDAVKTILNIGRAILERQEYSTAISLKQECWTNVWLSSLHPFIHIQHTKKLLTYP